MNKKLVTLLSLLVFASFVLAACQPSAPEVSALKIGEVHPFTGALAEFGEPEHNSALLAAKHLEEAGYKIETVFGDTETDAIPAVEAARRLVEVEGVQVLIGAAASGVSIPIAESVSIPNQIPQISYASTSPLLTFLPADQAEDFLFRTCPSDALQGPVLAKLLFEEGLTNVATMFVNNPYGQGLNDQFKLAFEDLGGTVSAEIPHDEAVATSYTAELAQATEGNPEALVAISYPGHASIYMKEAIEGGFISEFRFVDGTKSETDIPQAVGAEAIEGMCGTAPGSAETPSLDTFNSTYEAEYGEVPPLPFMTTTYDAVILAALAAYEAQVAGEELTGVAVRDHLRSVAGPPGELVYAGEGLKRAIELLADGQDIDYVGAAGDVNFDQFGDVVTPIDIWCYEGGVPVVKSSVIP